MTTRKEALKARFEPGAWQCVAQLGEKAVAHVKDLVGEANATGLALLFSLRNDFPTEWSAFVTGVGDFSATIRKDYFPYFTQGQQITIAGLELVGCKNLIRVDTGKRLS